MWFEILPSMGIIFVALAAPHGVSYVLNKLVIDNHFRRSLLEREDRYQYFRDGRLTGDPYKVQEFPKREDSECSLNLLQVLYFHKKKYWKL